MIYVYIHHHTNPDIAMNAHTKLHRYYYYYHHYYNYIYTQSYKPRYCHERTHKTAPLLLLLLLSSLLSHTHNHTNPDITMNAHTKTKAALFKSCHRKSTACSCFWNHRSYLVLFQVDFWFLFPNMLSFFL